MSSLSDPFDRQPCSDCGRLLCKKGMNHHPKLGSIFAYLCNNSHCGLYNKRFWFDRHGVKVKGPLGHKRGDLPMAREICPKCDREKRTTLRFHKASGRWLYRQHCRPGCPWGSSWYDLKGNKISLREFKGAQRKHNLPNCPACQTESVRALNKHKTLEEFYAHCTNPDCNLKFAWNPKTNELRVRAASIRVG